MPLTHTQHVVPAATVAADLCTRLKAVYKDIAEFLDTNSDLSIDWSANTGAVINEDADGNVDGFKFTHEEVSNAIGSLAQFRNLIENAAASQGDHLGNLNKLADVSTG